MTSKASALRQIRFREAYFAPGKTVAVDLTVPKHVVAEPDVVVATVSLELVRQCGRGWEACAGCPAVHDPFTKGSLCNYLGAKANAVLGGFSRCGGGHTWRLKEEVK